MKEIHLAKNKIYFFIALVAVVLRIPVFIHPHFGMESLYILGLANNPLSNAISSAAACGHAPLYFIIMRLWSGISASQYWLLIPPMAFNLTAIATITLLTEKLAGRSAGAFAGFLAAASPLLIQYSASLRYENFVLLSSVLCMYFGFKILNGESKPFDILAYIISTVCGLYLFYYFAYLIIAQNVYFLYRRRDIKKWIVAQSISAMLFVPWIPVMFSQENEWLTESSTITEALKVIFLQRGIMNGPDVLITYMTGMLSAIHADDIFNKTSLLLAALLPLIIVTTAFTQRKKHPSRWRTIVYLLIVQAISIFLALLLNHWKHIPFVPKYAVAFCGGWFIILGAGLSTVKNQKLIIFALALSALCYAINLFPYYEKLFGTEEFQTVLNNIEAQEKKGDVILLYPPFFVSEVTYYYKGGLEVRGCPVDFNPVHNDSGQKLTEKQYRDKVREFSKYKRIWTLLMMDDIYPDDNNAIILEELSRMGYEQISEEKADGHGVTRLFEKRSEK